MHVNTILHKITPSTLEKDLTQSWLNRIRAASHTALSKDSHAQLQSLLDFYNRPVQDKRQETPIEWEDAKDSIHTKNVVDNIKKRYQEFMATQYNVDEAAQRAVQKSQKLKMLQIMNDYNFEVWYENFQQHLKQLEGLNAIGDASKCSTLEMMQYFPYPGAVQNGENQVGNVSMPFLVEENIAARMATQFSWGCKLDVPFTHSSEVTTAVGATLGKLGR